MVMCVSGMSRWAAIGPRWKGLSSAVGIASAFLLAGCNALAPVNPRIDKVDPDHGYRISTLLKRARAGDNDPGTLFLLTFSGGGTRAAAFSYGVLEELRRTTVTVKGQPRSLLSEVDGIAGVSGGSITALAYALHGEELFPQFEARFLKRNVQGDLASRALNPLNWLELASPLYGRSELAADNYDEILFKGATFGDLIGKNTPAVVVTGTDLSTGARFPFNQEHFDILCSDLSTVRLSRAAATSSAVPVVLSPVTYRNYGGTCNAPMPSWVKDVTKADEGRPAGRALLRYRDLQRYQDGVNRPYLHVVDGGVADNLGLRGLIESLEETEASPDFQREFEFSKLRRIVVIVANSRSAPTTNWDRSPMSPGPLVQLLQSSSVPIDHFSYESVELLKDIAQRWADKRDLKVAELRLSGMSRAQAEAAVPTLSFDAIDVSFDAIEDPEEQRYFMNLPTSFVLSAEEVDRLRALGGRLLRESPGYRDLLDRISDRKAPAKAGAPSQ